jgi:predicted O-methyltransferase YrrM
MSNKTINLTDELYRYMISVSLREPDLLRELRAETAADPMANMQIAPEQGQFMALLIKLMGAARTLEVGVFTGYSALSVALAMPASGKLTACDISEAWTSIARRYWERAGVADRIDLRLGPAVDTLDALITAGHAGSYDFAFIDADKENYDAYYEQSLQLLRPGGLIVIDNVLWDGRVADASVNDADTRAIRALNKKLHADPRVSLSLIPVADGLTLALKN